MANLIELSRELTRDRTILALLDKKIQENPAWGTPAVYQVAGELYFNVLRLTRELMHLENQTS